DHGPARRGGGGGPAVGGHPRGGRARVSDAVVQLLRRVEPVRPVSGQGVGRLHWTEPATVERVATLVASILPPALAPIFGPPFARSHHIFDDYVHRLTLDAVRAARQTWK